MKENGDSAKRIAPKRPWDLAEFLCIRWNIGHFRQHVILTTYNITRGDPNLLTLLTATTPYLTREACPSLSCLALLTSQMHYVNVYRPPWLPVVVDNIMWIITFLILAYKTFKLYLSSWVRDSVSTTRLLNSACLDIHLKIYSAIYCDPTKPGAEAWAEKPL